MLYLLVLAVTDAKGPSYAFREIIQRIQWPEFDFVTQTSGMPHAPSCQ
ncbi:hypothetical protein BURPS305_0810 [Burkholderia pseudomallei 305]|nr:hypothetical protein BURPS305_0810 [Burkholderia pseudomallei 305]